MPEIVDQRRHADASFPRDQNQPAETGKESLERSTNLVAFMLPTDHALRVICTLHGQCIQRLGPVDT